MKRNGKFYSSLFPHMVKKFSISNSFKNLKTKEITKPKSFPIVQTRSITLLFQNSELIKNKYDKQKIVSDLSKIIYALILAKDKSNSSKKKPPKSKDIGGAA